jgi:hypothetical protein
MERQKVLRLSSDILSNRQFLVAKPRPIVQKSKKKKRDEKGDGKHGSSGNYLRSVRMSQSATTANRVSSALKELQVPEIPATTGRVSKGDLKLIRFFSFKTYFLQVYSELKWDISILLDLYDQLIKAEHEAHLLRSLQPQSKAPISSAAPISSSSAISSNMSHLATPLPAVDNPPPPLPPDASESMLIDEVAAATTASA